MNDHFIDRFDDSKPIGTVIGTRSDGILRKGIDTEGQIGIDHGALRIQPLFHPGWGRAGIAYGPYIRENGLALGFHVLNGHNASHTTDLNVSLIRRLGRWAKGSDTDPLHVRILNWLKTGDKRRTFREFLAWYHIDRGFKNGSHPRLDDNLTLGWFSKEVPTDPTKDQNCFVIRGTGPENGALFAQVGKTVLPCVEGLQNIPLYFVIILRESGAAYYVSSVPGARGLGAYPNMRPLAIDPYQEHPEVYAALHQSVLGQIGFRADTRLYSAQVNRLPKFKAWYGTAHAADHWMGSGDLDRSPADIGGEWRVLNGAFERTAKGIKPVAKENFVLIKPTEPSGLIHFMMEIGSSFKNHISLIWQYKDAENYLELQFSNQRVHLIIISDGESTILDTHSATPLLAGKRYAVQVLDDGCNATCYLDGHRLCEAVIPDRHTDPTPIGIRTLHLTDEIHFHSFESHPRSLPIPTELAFDPPLDLRGEQDIIFENYSTHGSKQLQGKETTIGGEVWNRNLGKGIFELTNEPAAKVQATVQRPNPGRTIYSIPWKNPDFAELSVEITPPGSNRGQSEKGRAGLAFWQDPDNYIIINTWLDDHYEGASISSFFKINGFEEIFDAVWTNVGERISWGKPYTLRVIFDSVQYRVYLNDEAVLYRALTDIYPTFHRLSINQVGIVANWEWGNDTGSKFQNFCAKDIKK